MSDRSSLFIAQSAASQCGMPGTHAAKKIIIVFRVCFSVDMFISYTELSGVLVETSMFKLIHRESSVYHYSSFQDKNWQVQELKSLCYCMRNAKISGSGCFSNCFHPNFYSVLYMRIPSNHFSTPVWRGTMSPCLLTVRRGPASPSPWAARTL